MASPFETRSNIFKKDIIHDYSFFDPPFQKWRQSRLHSKILRIKHIQISLNNKISFVIIHFSILLSKNGASIRKFYVSHIQIYLNSRILFMIITKRSFFDSPSQKWRQSHLYSKILHINAFKYL